jgi:hypothetical protein
MKTFFPRAVGFDLRRREVFLFLILVPPLTSNSDDAGFATLTTGIKPSVVSVSGAAMTPRHLPVAAPDCPDANMRLI